MIENLPLHAKVICDGGVCGSITNIILHLKTREVTHVVVRERKIPHREWIVPINKVKESALERVCLDCSRKKLCTYRPFITMTHIQREVPQLYTTLRECGLVPDRDQEKVYMWEKREQVPPGEVAIHKGARVKSFSNRKGNGKVIAFQIDPNSHQISNLIIMKGFPWNRKQTSIPASQIKYFGEHEIYLGRND